jgi:ABC-type phosphate transport system substrate-binding protein
MVNKTASFIAGWLLLTASTAAFGADFVVIVNKANATPIDKALVAKLYTGDAKNWADGTPVALIDQDDASAVRAEFAQAITGKSVASLRALWAQHTFSGRALPPKVVGGDAAVKSAVAANRAAIGYVSAGSVDDSVRVVRP